MTACLVHIADPEVPGGWRPATAADFAGTGPGAGGDASAANQATQITRETEIRDRLPASLVSGRLPVETVQQSGSISTVRLRDLIQDVVSIASLAGSATATGAVIDLGATHATATVTCIKSAGAGQADTVMLEQSDDGSNWIQMPRADSTPGNALAWSNASGINCVVIGRPSMRYVRAKIIGGAGAQPAGAQLVTAVHWGV